MHPPQFLAVSLLLPLASTLLFSRTGGVLSHRNSSTNRFPRFPTRNLCSFVTLAVPSLVYAATHTTYCRALFSLELAELRVLPAASADTRPRTPLISFCTVLLRTLFTAHSLATLCVYATFGPGSWELPGFWGSRVLHHAPIHRKGRVATTTLHSYREMDKAFSPSCSSC